MTVVRRRSGCGLARVPLGELGDVAGQGLPGAVRGCGDLVALGSPGRQLGDQGGHGEQECQHRGRAGDAAGACPREWRGRGPQVEGRAAPDGGPAGGAFELGGRGVQRRPACRVGDVGQDQQQVAGGVGDAGGVGGQLGAGLLGRGVPRAAAPLLQPADRGRRRQGAGPPLGQLDRAG